VEDRRPRLARPQRDLERARSDFIVDYEAGSREDALRMAAGVATETGTTAPPASPRATRL
jgi:hypothetical protein